MKPPKSFAPESFEPDPPKPDPQRREDYLPPTINRPTSPSPGFFFPGKQAEYHKNQTADVIAKTDLQIAMDSAAARREMTARGIDHELENQPTRLEEKEQLTQAAHETLVQSHHLAASQSKAQSQLTSKALERDMDSVTFGQLRLAEETERIRIQGRKKDFSQDLAKAKVEARLNVKKAADMARVTIDMILAERMFSKEEVLSLQAKLFKQIDTIEGLMRLPPSEGREFKLQLARNVMTGWMDELNGILQQTPKGDVPRPDGEKSRGLGAAPEPRTDIGEDD